MVYFYIKLNILSISHSESNEDGCGSHIFRFFILHLFTFLYLLRKWFFFYKIRLVSFQNNYILFNVDFTNIEDNEIAVDTTLPLEYGKLRSLGTGLFF